MQITTKSQNPSAIKNIKNLNDNNLADFLFVASKENLYSELQSEGVILSLTNGTYYGVNEVGASIWKAIQEPVPFQAIHNAVMNEYDVDSETCQQQILAFLKKMFNEDLVEILNEKAV